MSKRRQSRSPSPPAKLIRPPTPERGSGIICTLPPTCNRHPAALADAQALERHYRTYHTYVCREDGCLSVFPDERLLDLHFAECHDPIVAIRKERGDKTFACFISTCIRTFETPAKRRMHLIDAHHYPKEYFFAVTNKGIGGLLEKWGDGVSLLRPEWKPRSGQQGSDKTSEDSADPSVQSTSAEPLTPPHDPLDTTAQPQAGGSGAANGLGLNFFGSENTLLVDPVAAGLSAASNQAGPSSLSGHAISNFRKPPIRQLAPNPAQIRPPAPSGRSVTSKAVSAATSAVDVDADAAIDDLSSAMSSVSLVPRTIRFGRGGARAGFARPSASSKPVNRQLAARGLGDGDATMMTDGGG